ncbi:hypothetical protein J5N97_026317 [Dioscorea zingiberensis]|uniref:Uncharacterized protein n=1 Tax=Dioscorea zingiberensis TaxID=325984 RepID=A0A9D5H6D4_9LILI|nr:hypothetical protein J5N97_026317 [Dioscorea zingiberensis]
MLAEIFPHHVISLHLGEEMPMDIDKSSILLVSANTLFTLSIFFVVLIGPPTEHLLHHSSGLSFFIQPRPPLLIGMGLEFLNQDRRWSVSVTIGSAASSFSDTVEDRTGGGDCSNCQGSGGAWDSFGDGGSNQRRGFNRAWRGASAAAAELPSGGGSGIRMRELDGQRQRRAA